MRLQLRTIQAVYGTLIMACGMAFLVWSRLWPEAMSVATYGYAAYDTDAEIWALAYISAGALVLIGAGAGSIWRGAFAARMLAFVLLGVMSYLLALSAWDADNGAPVVIFSALFFGPAAAIFGVLTVCEHRAGRGHGDGRD